MCLQEKPQNTHSGFLTRDIWDGMKSCTNKMN